MDSSDITLARKRNPQRRIFDWITEPRPENITPFQQFILDRDWQQSPLGPISTWPLQLKQTVLLVVQDQTPAVVYWGDGNTIVYNEPYIQLIGEKHPSLQGQDPKIGFAEIWVHFEELLSNQKETGETVVEKNACLMLHRHGFLEETYFSWKFVPLIGLEGWVVGSHATVVEVTREVISDRRLLTVQSLSRQFAEASTIKDLWRRLILGIQDADKDIPLALLYSCSAPRGGSGARSPELPNPTLEYPMICTLEGCIGVEPGHQWAPESLNLHEDDHTRLGLWMRKAMEQKEPVLILVPDELRKGTWRGHGPATNSVICPIIPTNTESALGFLVIALNPRRPFDEDYRSFINLLTEQVTRPQLQAMLLREEVDRRGNLARQEAIDRERLYKELSDAETKFARFATRAPIGLAILKPDGLAISANSLWRELTMLEVGESKVAWENVLVKGQVEPVFDAWERMIEGKRPVTMDTIINRPWKAPELDSNGNSQYGLTFILLAMYPDLDEFGEVSTVMSCITDISGLKWSENQLRKKMDQAIEMKKQQERFIDMTSHEMRNPLSALIGCADEITTSLREYISDLKKTSVNETQQGSLQAFNLLEEAMEASETIIYCAMHQKRIIDDILTLSRLDSNLLLVSPEPSQPVQLVRTALKMFEAEVKRAGVRLDFIEQETLILVEWTLLDPSRTLQVLINLMTNAIKFTRTEAKKHIQVTMGASVTKPSIANEFGVEYISKSATTQDQTGTQEWGNGEAIFLTITVKDTGRGLSVEEKQNLFSLFQQASPKTHVQYGGSGLGLFICRQMAEMHGGAIGVASEKGIGSTFQFYIKTRRTTPPATELPQRADVQLLVREDALREACGVELPTLQNGTSTPTLQIKTSLRPATPPLNSPKSFHILVVEDNLVNQKVVSKQLRKAGHIVSVSNHGEEALHFIRKTDFWVDSTGDSEKLHVVLMDLEMPVMDGLTCVKNIRQYQKEGLIMRHVPVIAVTANARKDQIMASTDAGMDDVTTKPYRVKDMLRQIEALVAKHGGLDSARSN